MGGADFIRDGEKKGILVILIGILILAIALWSVSDIETMIALGSSIALGVLVGEIVRE